MADRSRSGTDDGPALRAALLAVPGVAAVVEVADAPIYAVGGVVRDLILGRPLGPDVDLVVEGSAIGLARRAARALGTPTHTHPRFGTAELAVPDGPLIDFATARVETYAAPGALPTIEPASIDRDLARRDFAINAVALRIDAPAEILDPHGGRADIAAGLVRTIRPGAFAEDPSRIVRAARYVARLGFALAPSTEAEARVVAPDLDPGTARVADELSRAAGEDVCDQIMAVLAALGVGWIGAPPPGSAAAVSAALSQLGAPVVPGWAVRLGLALAPGSLARMAVAGRDQRAASAAANGPALLSALAACPSMSEADAVLRRAHPAAAVAAAALGAPWVEEWWAWARDLSLRVGGDDLVAAGVRGPAIGRALTRVRTLVLDGVLADDREAQLRVALEDR